MHHKNDSAEEAIELDVTESIETPVESSEMSSSAEVVHADDTDASEAFQVVEENDVNGVTSTELTSVNNNISNDVTNGIAIIPLERLKYGDDYIKNCVRDNLEAKDLIVKSINVHRDVADGVFFELMC